MVSVKILSGGWSNNVGWPLRVPYPPYDSKRVWAIWAGAIPWSLMRS